MSRLPDPLNRVRCTNHRSPGSNLSKSLGKPETVEVLPFPPLGLSPPLRRRGSSVPCHSSPPSRPPEVLGTRPPALLPRPRLPSWRLPPLSPTTFLTSLPRPPPLSSPFPHLFLPPSSYNSLVPTSTRPTPVLIHLTGTKRDWTLQRL